MSRILCLTFRHTKRTGKVNMMDWTPCWNLTSLRRPFHASSLMVLVASKLTDRWRLTLAVTSNGLGNTSTVSIEGMKHFPSGVSVFHKDEKPLCL